MIKGTVNGQSLRLSYPTLVSDTIAYLRAEFHFAGTEWQGLSKWAYFKQGDCTYSICLADDAIPASAHLNLSGGEWEVYLHGFALENGEVKQRITTKPQKLFVEASGDGHGEPFPITPPTVGEQILATASEALSVARRAEENTAQYAQNMDMVLEAILIEQESILAMQDALIGGLV